MIRPVAVAVQMGLAVHPHLYTNDLHSHFGKPMLWLKTVVMVI